MRSESPTSNTGQPIYPDGQLQSHMLQKSAKSRQPPIRNCGAYMYHIFFIHSSVHEHLGCCHVLAIVNSAAINTGDTRGKERVR